MALTTYAELQTVIADYLDRTDLTDRIKDFITASEAEMQRRLQHWRMEARTTISADAQFEDVPADFLAPIRLSLDVSGYRKPLQLSSVDGLQDLRGTNNNSADYPTHYAVVGDQFEFWPTPSAATTVDVYYRQEIPALSDANTSNWLLALAPDAYLYGALKHSAPLLQEDGRLATWNSLFDQAIGTINLEGKRGRFGGSGIRMRVK